MSSIFRPIFLSLVAGALLLASTACTHLGAKASAVEPPERPAHEILAEYTPTPGTSYDDVAAILGEPLHRGRTKDGNHHIMWRVQWTQPRPGAEDVTMYHHHSIEFDQHWRVVRTFR